MFNRITRRTGSSRRVLRRSVLRVLRTAELRNSAGDNQCAVYAALEVAPVRVGQEKVKDLVKEESEKLRQAAEEVFLLVIKTSWTGSRRLSLDVVKGPSSRTYNVSWRSFLVHWLLLLLLSEARDATPGRWTEGRSCRDSCTSTVGVGITS
ncbi:hypothetical protein WJX79_004400 [Trebouxia sp. C0005]